MTTETKEHTALVNLTINGKAVAVPKGTTVYHAATEHGFELPIFCYQDRMPPFGACRVCLVEVEKMGKLQTSCTLEASEGMVVNTQSHLAVQGRQDILEFLLINHPLDCPVCDKGGECPLQDQTLKFGPGLSQFYEEKRRFIKPYALGPLLMLDRERCIVCARCTRFGDLIAGDNALEFVERGFRTEVGTPGGKPVESKFIGNTISICPVGALTSEVYRFRARPWDNKHTATACTLCPVGCSMILDERDGELMRTRSLENREVNDVWMCDKGWFGYEFATYRARLQKPMIRRKGQLEVASWDEALHFIAQKFIEAKASQKIAGWGGNPLTTEENYLFQKLIREGGGSNHVDHRIGAPIFSLEEEGIAPGMEIGIGECEKLSTVLLLGADITEEFPVIWLRLKQGINHGAKCYYAGHYAPEIAPHLSKVLLHPPGEEIKAINQLLEDHAEQIRKGECAVLVGRQYLASAHRAAILSTLVNYQESRPGITLNLLEGRGNSMGARLAGMHPELKPFGERLETPGFDAQKVLETAAAEGWGVLYVAGADPAVKFPAKQWKEAREKLGCLVVQDIFMTETARQADVVLPSLCYLEKSGTFVNIAHTAQALQRGKDVPAGIYSDSKIFRLVAEKLRITLTHDIDIRAYKPAKPTKQLNGFVPASKIAKGLRATFAQVLFDKGTRMKHNPHLLQIVKEPHARMNPTEAEKRGLRDGDNVHIKANGTTISGTLFIDNSVADGTIVLPLGFDELPVHNFSANLLNGLEVDVTA